MRLAHRLAALMGLALAAFATSAPAQETGLDTTLEAIDQEVVVAGRLPGPQLWYVSTPNGGELFILGTLDPLPAALQWDSSALNSIIGQTDLVLTPPTVSGGLADGARVLSILVTTMLFRRDTLYLPDEKKLADVASPELTARYIAAAAKAEREVRQRERPGAARNRARDDRQLRELEQDAKEGRLLPFWLANGLYADTLKGAGLDEGQGEILDEVRSIARKNKIRLQSVQKFPFEASDLKVLLAAVRNIPMSEQLACLDAVVTLSERHVPELQARANAWALGDVARLRAVAEPGPLTVCTKALEMQLGALASLGGRRPQDIEPADLWVARFEESLAQPGARLAIAPMEALLKRDGVLDRLRAAGYAVTGP